MQRVLAKNESNEQLWRACIDNPDMISIIIKDCHGAIDIHRFFYDFNAHRVQSERNPSIKAFSNEAITLVLEAYLPLASTHTAKRIFKILCRDPGNPDLVWAFIKLLGSQLTAEVMGVGLDAALSVHRRHGLKSHFPDIIEKHMGLIDQQSYWTAICICCQDRRSDLVGRLIDTYGYLPNKERYNQLRVCVQYCCVNEDMQTIRLLLGKYGEIICEPLIIRCSHTKSVSILKTVFTEYKHLLTTEAIIAGFDSACKITAAIVIQVYVDQFDCFSDSCFDPEAVQLCCSAGLDEAIKVSAVEVVDILLDRCLSFLQFESGHKSLLPYFKPREGMMSDCHTETLIGPNAEISRLMRDAYGPRLSAGFSHWSIKAQVSP